MYTEEDLRATFGALEQEAPDERGVLAGLARARRRRTVRRRTAGILAAAVATVVAVTAAVVTPQLIGHQVAASPHFERWRYPFAMDDLPGYRVYQSKSSAWVTAGAPRQYELTIYKKGRYGPTADQGGEPVDVRGKHGFYRTDMDGPESGAGVVWEYAPDSWAAVGNVTGTPPAEAREDVLRIAGAVRFDRTAPLRVPYRVGYVPAGLQAVASSREPDITIVDTIGPTLAMAGRPGSLTIVAVYRMTNPMRSQPVVTADPQTGRPVVTISLNQLHMRLTATGISTDELKKIAKSITPAADPNDPATWFDADKAIPLH